MTKSVRYAGLALGIFAIAAAARQPDAFDACAQQHDSATRLACYDHEVVARGPAGEAPARRDDTGLDRPRPASVSTAVRPIEAIIVSVTQRQPFRDVFELDNGQTWEQTESSRINAQPRQKVTIEQGVLGSFLLRTSGGEVVRVRRLK